MDITSYLLGKKSGGGGGANLQTKEVTITENGTTNINPDTGYDGMSRVDVTVSGILDTSDANATASDIAQGKSGYVNGVKVNGNVPVGSPVIATNYASTDASLYLGDLKVDTIQGNTNQFFNTGDKISVLSPLSDIAPVVGASAEKIKKDEVICGVTGTYEGSGEDYTIKIDISASSYNVYQGFRSFITEIKGLDLSNISNATGMFQYCLNLTSISDINTTNVKNFTDFFTSCTHLVNAPMLDSSDVSEFRKMFSGCQALVNVPIYDTSKSTNFLQMFTNCPSLSNDSLNNILKMCINATIYSGTKTLATLGLTSSNYPASTIQGLSNYQDFINAGWTIGY